MPTEASQAVRFHLSLNVSDLRKSVPFFQMLFGSAPAKQRDDYAKFELLDPPLVLSLEPHAPAGRGALNHVGFRFANSAALVAAQQRLEMAGIHTQREEGVECCYARQTKFWVNDPDGNLWEFYTLEEDIDHRGAGQAPEKVLAPAPAAAPADWEHRLGQPFELPAGRGLLAEVRLRGTFNVPCSHEEVALRLRQAEEALRPGGKLLLHILTAEVPFPGAVNLSGPAAHVKHVPVRRELLAALEAAGFTAIHLTKFGASPCFVQDGIEMRETMISAVKPVPEGSTVRTVMYKGPFALVTDDEGREYRRGERTEISEAQWNALSQSAIGEQFLCFPAPDVVALT
jgi:catechol 2,3-dioxygenase-like lactoylglutathione lyase family enzyme